MPAATNDRATAGPAFSRATCPVSTKMPVPTITPIPNTVRSSADGSLRNRRPVVTPSASLIDCSTGLVLMRLIHRSRDVPSTRERSPDVAGRNQQVPEKYRTQDMAGGLLGGLGLDFVGDPGDRLGGVAGGILGP